MNKKGFTVVELILSFSMVMILVIGLISLVNNYRAREEKEVAKRDLNTYKNMILKDIYDDIYVKRVIGINQCTTDDSETLSCITLKFADNTSKNLLIKIENITVDDDGTTFAYPTFNIIYGNQKYPNPIPKFADIIIDSTNPFLTVKENIPYSVHYADIYKISIGISHQSLNEPVNIEFVIPVLSN